MPRQARKKCESRIYHVMLRGINQQLIFQDEDDSRKFLDVLREYKEVCGYELHAYCLMGNHLHLLIKEQNEPLAQVFRRICGRYVYWYNNKYQRIGHLFQDRYKSEPVENNSYYLTVIRYIHQNPIKAGLCDKVGDYPFSSYNEYVNDDKNKIINTDLMFEIINKVGFVEYNNEKNDDKCLDIIEKHFGINDEEAKKIIRRTTKCENVSEFQLLEFKVRDKYIFKLKEKGLSIRQISRLTGISKGIVERVT